MRETEALKIIGQEQAQEAQLLRERVEMGLSRKADAATIKKKGDQSDR